MKIIGLDLSMTATGVALPDGSTRMIKPRTKGDQRLLEIRAQLRAAAAGADLAVIENFAKFQGEAAKTVPMVHAVARVLLMDMEIPYVYLAQATLKKFATGRGNCDKTAMIMAAYKRSGIEYRDDNEADAAWLRWAGMDHYGMGVFRLPAAQSRALDVVSWPLGARVPQAA